LDNVNASAMGAKVKGKSMQQVKCLKAFYFKKMNPKNRLHIELTFESFY